MRKERKLLAVAAALALLLTQSLPANALWPFPSGLAGEGEQGAFLAEQQTGPKISYIAATKIDPSGKLQSELCTAYGQGVCAEGSGWGTYAHLQLGTCVNDEVNCIESVQIYSEGEAAKPATFLKNVEGPTFPGDTALGLPRGSTAGIWQAQNLEHGGGSKNYAAWASVFVGVSNGKVNYYNFSAGVVGVKEATQAINKVPTPAVMPGRNSGETNISVNNAGLGCVYSLDGICAEAQTFAPNTRVGMKLRISNSITGWLLGRLVGPSIEVSPISDSINLLSVDGAPTLVPTVIHHFNESNFPDAYKTSATLKYFWDRITAKAGAALKDLKPGSLEAVDFVEAIRTAKNDTAGPLSNIWFVNSLPNASSSNRCLNDKTRLVGLVTTNSMAYEGGAPTFSKGFLQYKVAGMHYLEDKSLALGTYDLIIRSDTARCLYGFGKAPISATVSVVNEKGTKTKATTVVSEKNGWLKLAAYGFTFSNKTIMAKITQKAIKKTTKKK